MGWEVHKNQCRGGRLPKKMGGGGLGLFADLRGSLARKRGVVFLRGEVETPMDTMMLKPVF